MEIITIVPKLKITSAQWLNRVYKSPLLTTDTVRAIEVELLLAKEEAMRFFEEVVDFLEMFG